MEFCCFVMHFEITFTTMKYSLIQKLMLIFCLVLQGSVVQADICNMPMDSSVSEVRASMTDHGNHDMTMKTDQTEQQNCCSEKCECVMFSCQIAYSVNQGSIVYLIAKTQLSDFSHSSILMGIHTSIYRPPIFT